MTVEQLRAKLVAQLVALEASGPFAVHIFEVWTVSPETRTALGAALVRVEPHTWSWGYCSNERCQHQSHDPYGEGCSAFVRAIPISENEYRTVEGVVFTYEYSEQGQYAPFARIVC